MRSFTQLERYSVNSYSILYFVIGVRDRYKIDNYYVPQYYYSNSVLSKKSEKCGFILALYILYEMEMTPFNSMFFVCGVCVYTIALSVSV
jgi:hypothetical protein